MTNLDPKKNKKNELAEEKLDSVVGGATSCDAAKDDLEMGECMLIIPNVSDD